MDAFLGQLFVQVDDYRPWIVVASITSNRASEKSKKNFADKPMPNDTRNDGGGRHRNVTCKTYISDREYLFYTLARCAVVRLDRSPSRSSQWRLCTRLSSSWLRCRRSSNTIDHTGERINFYVARRRIVRRNKVNGCSTIWLFIFTSVGSYRILRIWRIVNTKHQTPSSILCPASFSTFYFGKCEQL